MSLAAIVRALAAAGATPDQIAAAVEAAEASMIAAHDARRVKARDKKRRQRLSPSVPGTTGDNEGQSPLKEIPPTPPKENNPPTLSEANASSSEPREGTTSAPMARAEFESEFWQHYPNKVGKVKALDAYIAARRKATRTEILDGLARYKSDKPPDRQWLNPATFLNQERWNDDPAPAPSRQQSSKPEPAHDPLFRALANVAYGRDGGGEWTADDDVRLLDHDRGATPA